MLDHNVLVSAIQPSVRRDLYHHPRQDHNCKAGKSRVLKSPRLNWYWVVWVEGNEQRDPSLRKWVLITLHLSPLGCIDSCVASIGQCITLPSMLYGWRWTSCIPRAMSVLFPWRSMKVHFEISLWCSLLEHCHPATDFVYFVIYWLTALFVILKYLVWAFYSQEPALFCSLTQVFTYVLAVKALHLWCLQQKWDFFSI